MKEKTVSYITCRRWYKYGNEGDEIEVTIKEFGSIDKAINYAHRYAKGIRFCGVEIQDENGNTVYEITAESAVYDNRRG